MLWSIALMYKLLPAMPRKPQTRQLCALPAHAASSEAGNRFETRGRLHRVASRPAVASDPMDYELEDSPLNRLLPYIERDAGIGFEKPKSLKPAHDELKERQRIGVEALQKFIFGGDQLVELDDLFERYRNTDERTPSGLSKLSAVYHEFTSRSYQVLAEETYHLQQLKKIDDWQRRQPQSIAAKMLRAIVLREYAFATLNDTSIAAAARNKRLFKERLKPLVSHLREIKQDVAHMDAYWYVLMLEARAAQEAKTPELFALLDEGSKAFPTEINIYLRAAQAIASSSDQPLIDLDAVALLASFRGSAEGPSAFYARTYWGIGNLIVGTQNLRSLKVDWKRFTDGAREVIEKYPVQWNIQSFAALFCFAGEAKTASEFFKLVEGRPVRHAWGSIDVHDKCRDWANDPVNLYGKNSVPLEQ